MIDRNHVADEKMTRAAEMLRERDIDLWVVYSRLKTDTAMALMFNTDTENEALFMLTKDGARYAVCEAADEAAFATSGL